MRSRLRRFARHADRHAVRSSYQVRGVGVRVHLDHSKRCVVCLRRRFKSVPEVGTGTARGPRDVTRCGGLHIRIITRSVSGLRHRWDHPVGPCLGFRACRITTPAGPSMDTWSSTSPGRWPVRAGMMLGDLGARVVKVETPEGGDDSRGWGPPFVGPQDKPISTYFLSCNRNKESVTADLKTGEGRDVFTGLVRRADVLLENFRRGFLDRLGFDLRHLQELNPRLVILSITGFGHDGPEAARAGYDQIAQGAGGTDVHDRTAWRADSGRVADRGPLGRDVRRIRCPGSAARPGAHRARTVVRTSLLLRSWGCIPFRALAGRSRRCPKEPGNHHPSIAPYGLFHAADGPIQIAVGSEAQWRALAPAVGLDPADPRYATNRDRVAHRESLLAAIDSALAAESSATWLERLDKLGIPAGQVRSLDQVYGQEQTRSQGGDHRRSSRPGSHRVARATAAVRRSIIRGWTGNASAAADARSARRPGTCLARRPGDINVLAKLAGVRVLIALGGNAMTAPGGGARRRPDRRHRHGGRALPRSLPLVTTSITHGNGPQVGNILVKNEIAASVVPPVPLDWCGAQAQGTVGFVVERAGAQPR